MADRFYDWLAGFIDGEGCFLISPYANRVRMSFVLAVRADDRAILDEIVQRTGIGHVKAHFAGDATRAPQVRWEVASQRDARALVDLLDTHPLRAKKARDYAVWREAVLAREALALPPHRHRGPAVDWTPFRDMMVRLRSGRAYAEVL